MRRRLTDIAFRIATGLCACVACGLLVVIVWAICQRGWPALSWRFFTEQIRLVGADGGIFYNILGTGILVLTALAVSAPLATAIALVQAVYLRGRPLGAMLGLFLQVLNGVPSLSVPDGWWLEGCIEEVTGWAIGGDTDADNASDGDALRKCREDSRYDDDHSADKGDDVHECSEDRE